MRPGMRLLLAEKVRQNGRGEPQGNRYGNDMTMGGYGMESNQGGQMRNEMQMGNPEMARRYSRDRRGRFTGEMGYEGPYSGGNRYDIDVNRYEYEAPEGNYRNEMRGGRNGDRRGDTRGEEGGTMRMIGFGREIYNNDMRSDASVPNYREGDHMTGSKPKKGGAKSDMGMDEHLAKEWTAMMENEDGTKGPHWSMEQIKKVIEQRGMPGDPVEIWVAMNMMYSDYCKVAKKLGVNTMDFYAEMARAFLDDKDAGVPDKLTAYYEYIVKG